MSAALSVDTQAGFGRSFGLGIHGSGDGRSTRRTPRVIRRRHFQDSLARLSPTAGKLALCCIEASQNARRRKRGGPYYGTVHEKECGGFGYLHWLAHIGLEQGKVTESFDAQEFRAKIFHH